MSRPSAPFGHSGIGRRGGCGLAADLLAALLLGAAPAGAQPVSLYPPASQFRSLQLLTLSCGRDNTSASCDKARAMADPLLDHPRLSASCKDSLWAIRQKAVTAPTNSPERRDGIDRAAKDVTVLCRQPNRPATAGGTGAAGAPPGAPQAR